MGTSSSIASGNGTTGDRRPLQALLTPAPWQLFESPDARPHEVFISMEIGSYKIPHSGYSTDVSKEAIANARLIAAAPDMLVALKLITPFLEGYLDEIAKMSPAKREAARLSVIARGATGTAMSATQQARGAIAKAEGLRSPATNPPSNGG